MAIVYHVSAIKGSINKAVDYVGNKDKTSCYSQVKSAVDYVSQETKVSKNEKELLTGYNCSSDKKIFQLEMDKLKKVYNKSNGILAHHYIQSFAPGEINNPEQALEIGYKLASECFSNYQVLIATHTDKKHIHNHFIINSVGLDGKKYVDTKKQLNFNRSVSDRLCKEYGLSVIEKPKEKGKSYKEWTENKKGTSWKDHIKKDIDETIKISKSFEDFISNMKSNGYQIKYGDVKYLSFKPKDKERFVRGKTLGSEYTEEYIKNKIRFNVLGLEVKDFNRKRYIVKGKIKRKNTRTVYSKFATTIALVNLVFGRNKKYYSNKKFNPSEKYRRYISYRAKVVNNLAEQLMFIKEKNIKNSFDIKENIKNIDTRISKLESNIVKLEEINKKLLQLQEFANVYIKNKEYIDTYNKSKFKVVVKTKYSKEIEKGLDALNKLKTYGIDEKELYKIQDNLNDSNEKIKNIKDKLKDIKLERIKFKQVSEIVEKFNYSNEKKSNIEKYSILNKER
ncbi:MAG: relaxase/mobilization nuclease domain-containing protein [Bacilli bacterium]